MVYRIFFAPLVVCLLLLVATPSTGVAQPPHEKKVWSYDGGLVLITDGALVDGPCFRLSGRATSSHFFDNLRRVDTDTGTIYRRGHDLITEFPERLNLSFEMYDWPCSDKLQPSTARAVLNKSIMSSLRMSFYWKRGTALRPATEVVRTHAEAQIIEPYGGEKIKDVTPRYEWWFNFDVPSAGVPLTDSLVIILRSQDGRIAARVAARM